MCRADTLFPVYFLADAASYFAKTDPMRATRYLQAAVRGGDCAWDLYGRPALFVAGDYVPSVDKEAGKDPVTPCVFDLSDNSWC